MRITQYALLVLLFPAVSGANTAVSSGVWTSAPDETRLSTAFEESVWGKNATAIRTVQMSVMPSGAATLTITRKVVDARGRTVPASTSIEQANLVLGDVKSSNSTQSELATTVERAERRYPDDPAATWVIEGLQVGVFTFTDKPEAIDIRVDFPEGRGSFWETLRLTSSRQPGRR